MKRAYERNRPGSFTEDGYCQSFQLLGVDVLLDENLKPWMLEVNSSPSLSSAYGQSQLDFNLKHGLVRDALNLVLKRSGMADSSSVTYPHCCSRDNTCMCGCKRRPHLSQLCYTPKPPDVRYCLSTGFKGLLELLYGTNDFCVFISLDELVASISSIDTNVVPCVTCSTCRY